MNKKTKPKKFTGLNDKDKDLTMFTITNLTLAEEDDIVYMALKLKRKVATELLTPYLSIFSSYSFPFHYTSPHPSSPLSPSSPNPLLLFLLLIIP